MSTLIRQREVSTTCGAPAGPSGRNSASVSSSSTTYFASGCSFAVGNFAKSSAGNARAHPIATTTMHHHQAIRMAAKASTRRPAGESHRRARNRTGAEAPQCRRCAPRCRRAERRRVTAPRSLRSTLRPTYGCRRSTAIASKMRSCVAAAEAVLTTGAAAPWCSCPVTSVHAPRPPHRSGSGRTRSDERLAGPRERRWFPRRGRLLPSGSTTPTGRT